MNFLNFKKPANDPYAYSINTTNKPSSYNYPVSTGPKSDPYAYQIPNSTSAKNTKQGQPSKKQRQKGPPEDWTAQRLGLSYNPPTILIEYRDNKTKKLYHHPMKMKKLTKDTKTSDAMDYLKKKHKDYYGAFDKDQLEKLIDKLKSKITDKNLKTVPQSKNQQQEEQVDEEDYDFDYDYEDQEGQ